jgi:hypothetical protein
MMERRRTPETPEIEIQPGFINRLKEHIQDFVAEGTGYDFYGLDNVIQRDVVLEDVLRDIGLNLDELSSETDAGLTETFRELDERHSAYEMAIRRNRFMREIEDMKQSNTPTNQVLDQELNIVTTEFRKLWRGEDVVVGESVGHGTVYRIAMQRALKELLDMLITARRRHVRLVSDMTRIERIVDEYEDTRTRRATPAASEMPSSGELLYF